MAVPVPIIIDFVNAHALTIDVEDWFHVCGLEHEPVISRSLWRVRGATERILNLLSEHRVKATFFMLGVVAEGEPALARDICSAGHEVASHGWSHRLLDDLSPEAFRRELRDTEDLLIRQTGRKPVGYRAPRWSISDRTPWVHRILAEEGYHYDSSCNPLPLVGKAELPRHPYRIETCAGPLWEVPPMVTPTLFGNLPTGGGWGFRLFPLFLIRHTIARYGGEGQPAVLYLHPREVDPDGPRLDLSHFKRFASYGTRSDASPRLSSLCADFRFVTLEELVRSWQPVS